jgi:hypothetical protein
VEDNTVTVMGYASGSIAGNETGSAVCSLVVMEVSSENGYVLINNITRKKRGAAH